MDECEHLFLRTTEELRKKISPPWDSYSILTASGLLRKLLLDAHPLVDQVNRIHKAKVIYKANSTFSMESKFPNQLFIIGDGLDPATSPYDRSQRLSRDQFLSTGVIFTGQGNFSVRDVISISANVMGGVHAGVAKTDQEKLMKSLSRNLKLDDIGAPLVQLRAIGRVVATALEPLEFAVKQRCA